MVVRKTVDCFTRYFIRVFGVFICLAALFCLFPASARSLVIVNDMVALKGQEVMLRAETRGKFFPKGGQIVEFFVDGKSIGKTLSGGDGIAFKQFTPKKTGLHQIGARSGVDKDTGLLLCLTKGSSIVFVDMEGCLLERAFSMKPKPGSQKAIKTIHTRFPIVLLKTGFLSTKAIKAWLKKNEFPELPVFPWENGAIFDEISENNLSIKAIIAHPRVIESAQEHNPLCFSFQEVEDAEWVEDWQQISKKLK